MLKRLLRRFFKRGRYCPVCESEVDRFNPLPQFYLDSARRYGYIYSYDDSETMNYKEYECPNCHCSDRDRLYALYLKKYFRPEESIDKARFIDFAPSIPLSNFIKKTFENIDYRTADLMQDNVDDKVNITDMPIYGTSSVDFFICSHVLEHVSDDKKALRELYRILRPGGKGIVMAPIILSISETQENPEITTPEDRWKYYGQDDHMRMYSKQGFIRNMEEAGFAVHDLCAKEFGVGIFKRAGISVKSVLYIAAK